jgi:hypothetical protein
MSIKRYWKNMGADLRFYSPTGSMRYVPMLPVVFDDVIW